MRGSADPEKELFPAYAGVILELLEDKTGNKTFPRIRGGDPDKWNPVEVMGRFSPHTRG